MCVLSCFSNANITKCDNFRRLTLERLHAEERGRANQLLLQQYTSKSEEDPEQENPENGTKPEPDEKPGSEPEIPQVDPETNVDAFLDEIEGETLGQMLNYLSSELETNSDDADTAEAVRYKRFGSSEIRPKNVPFHIFFDRQRRAAQIDHVFAEITHVTQAAVDRYVDGILLNAIYKHAGDQAKVEADKEMTKSKLNRRSSTSDIDSSIEGVKVM